MFTLTHLMRASAYIGVREGNTMKIKVLCHLKKEQIDFDYES